MLSNSSFERFYKELDIQMNDLSKKLHTIPITKVENATSNTDSSNNL